MAVAVTLGVLGRPATTPMHVDEVYWIGSSYYSDLVFSQRDFSHPDWSLLPARENPPVAKYVIGFALAVAGQPITNPDMLGVFHAFYARIPGGWGNEGEQAKRAAVLARLNPEMREAMAAGAEVTMDKRILIAARRAMLGCAAGCSLLVFLLGSLLMRRSLALIASQVILLHPLSIEAYNYAMSDAPAMLFAVLAGGLVCVWAGRLAQPAARLDWGWSIGAGVGVGWACAAKMNSLVILGQAGLVALGWLGVALLRRDLAQIKRVAVGFTCLCVAALVVFVAVNPAIWRDPVGGLLAPYIEQKLSAELQAQFLGGFLGTLGERLEAVGTLTVLGSAGLLVVTLLALGGLRRPDWRRKAAACWWLFAVVAVTGWLPFARGRYLLPLVVPAVLIVGLALDEAWDLLARGRAVGVAGPGTA